MKVDTILTRRGGDGILFAEDFDCQDASPSPAVVAPPIPIYGQADVMAARAQGFEAGRIAARHDIEAEDEARLQHAIAQLAVQLDAATEVARNAAGDTADAIAGLLLSTLGAVLPTLCAAHGDAEAVVVARAMLPALTTEPAITIRAHPATLAALDHEILRIDADLMARIRFLPTETMLRGDVRIAWQDGCAMRDTTALWNEIVGVLVANGLIQPNPLPGASRHGE